MPCMCGDTACPSCGAAQGTYPESPIRCVVCQRWLALDNLTGTCPAPRECYATMTQRQLKADQEAFHAWQNENDLGLTNPTNQERKTAIRHYVLRSQP